MTLERTFTSEITPSSFNVVAELYKIISYKFVQFERNILTLFIKIKKNDKIVFSLSLLIQNQDHIKLQIVSTT